MEGWFKLYRKIYDHDIWKNPVDFRLFILILGKAVHHPGGVTIEGTKVNRGQWLRSYRNLQKDLEYREKRGYKQYGLATIKRAVSRLIQNGLVTVRETENGTLFTVVNYEKYQGIQETEERSSEHSSERHRNDIGTTSEQKEECKNEKNEKKIDDNDDWLQDDSDYPEITEIQNMFIQQANRFPSANDLYLISQALDNFPMETIRQGISGAFEYKRSQGEQIRSFSYCYKAIEGLHRKKTAGGKRYAKPDATRGNVHGRDQEEGRIDPPGLTGPFAKKLKRASLHM